MTDRDQRRRRIRDKAQAYVDAAQFAGIEWAVSHEGHPFDAGKAGFADAARRSALPEGAIYRIYSMTKPVVSVLALMLIEQGRLRLFDPVAKFLPAFAEPTVLQADGSRVDCDTPMTVEHLLTHRAGLSYDFVPDCPVGALCRAANLCDDPGRSLEELVAALAELPLAFQPGTRWQYSFATDVLAHLIERLADRPIGELLQSHILDPLGLDDTRFFVPPDKQERLMPMYGTGRIAEVLEQAAKPQALTPAAIESFYPSDPAAACERGGHGLFSTARDYLRFAEFLANGRDSGGKPLLSPATVALMWHNRIPPEQRPLRLGPIVYGGYGWSLFGRIMVDPGQAFCLTGSGEGGWLGAASTSFWVDREQAFAGVVMTQYLGSGLGLDKDMQTAAYQALP